MLERNTILVMDTTFTIHTKEQNTTTNTPNCGQGTENIASTPTAFDSVCTILLYVTNLVDIVWWV